MIPLILFIAMALGILIFFEVEARKKGKTPSADEEQSVVPNDDSGCCGQHLVCERETLLQTNAEIVYYDDEELDALAGIPASEFTDEQAQKIREVFQTMQEKDVPGWVRSLQLRNIQLPMDVREEALLIVVERRKQ